MQNTIDLSRFIRFNKLTVKIFALCLFYSPNNSAQSPSLRIDVSAFSNTPGIFEAYVDTRKLSAPYDVGSVALIIRCHLTSGQLGTIEVPFTDKMLSRGRLYHKIVDLPSSCTNWDRLVDADISLALGKASGPGAEVSIKKGALHGTSVSLTPPLSAPKPSSPTHGSVFSHYPRTTTLIWYPVIGAESYTIEIQMWSEHAWHTLKMIPNLRAPWYQFDFVGAQPGRWRVWASRPDGSTGYASPWWEFRYNI